MRPLLVLLIVGVVVAASGCTNEKESSLFVSQLRVQEDATSVHYYVAFRDDDQVHRLRYIWNGGCCSDPVVEEYHFSEGLLVRFLAISPAKDVLPPLLEGKEVPLSPKDDLRFSGIDMSEPAPAVSSGIVEAARDRLHTYLQQEQDAVRLP